MAISLQTVAMYQEQVQDKTNLWSSLEAINFEAKKQRIQSLVQELRDRERQMLSAIAPGLTIEELRANVTKYHQEGFSLLSNADAAAIVETYKRSVTKKNLMTLAQFDNWYRTVFYPKYLEPRIEKGILQEKGLEKAILEFVNSNLESGEHRISTHSRLTKLSNDKGLNFTTAELLNTLAKETQARILRKMGIKNPGRAEISEVNPSDGSYSEKIPIGEFDGTTYVDWFSLTQKGLKESEIQKMVNEGILDQESLKRQFVDTLSDYLSQRRLPLSIDKIHQILRYVIDKDPMAPYVGLNEKGITGLLGEIQALCYLALLCGDRFSLNNKGVSWAATETSKGRQYHADVLLHEAYGIQVKNTTKDIVDKVHFNSASLFYILDSMCDEGYITVQERDIITDVYTTYYFNQPYQNVEGTLVLGSNPDYAPTDDLVLHYVNIADKMMSYLIDYFMYIGVGDAAQNERGNLLYFLGGNSVVLASEICSAMLASIDGIQDFEITRSDRESSKIENIVSFTNNNNLLMSKGDKTFISNAASKIGASLHQTVSQQILLTSSYDFTNLLKGIYN